MNFWKKFLLFVLLVVSSDAYKPEWFWVNKCAPPNDKIDHGFRYRLKMNRECSFDGSMRVGHQYGDGIMIPQFSDLDAYNETPDELSVDISFGECGFNLNIQKADGKGTLYRDSFPATIYKKGLEEIKWVVNGPVFYVNFNGTIDVKYKSGAFYRFACNAVKFKEWESRDKVYILNYSQRVCNKYTNLEMYNNKWEYDDIRAVEISQDSTTQTPKTPETTTTESTTTTTQETTTTESTTTQAPTTPESTSSSTVSTTESTANVSVPIVALDGCRHCLRDRIKGANPIVVMMLFLCLEGAIVCGIVIDLIRSRRIFVLVPQRDMNNESNNGAADGSKKREKDQKLEATEDKPTEDKPTDGPVDKSSMTPSAKLSKFDEQVQTIRF